MLSLAFDNEGQPERSFQDDRSMTTETGNARQVAKIVTAHRQREGGGFIAA
jgi:hypothetical protein